VTDFLERANVRLMRAAAMATQLDQFDKPLARELLALVRIARAAIDDTAAEGICSTRIANAVTRYADPNHWSNR
jgi:hypothetical protein